MKKLYNFRLDTSLIKQVDKLEGSRTSIVIEALHNHLQGDTHKLYDVNMVDLLKDQIEGLKSDKVFLQNEIQALTVAKNPSLVEYFKYRLRGSNK